MLTRAFFLLHYCNIFLIFWAILIITWHKPSCSWADMLKCQMVFSQNCWVEHWNDWMKGTQLTSGQLHNVMSGLFVLTVRLLSYCICVVRLSRVTFSVTDQCLCIFPPSFLYSISISVCRIVLSTPLAVLCYFLIWYVPPFEEGKVFWYLVFYCLFQTLQTVSNTNLHTHKRIRHYEHMVAWKATIHISRWNCS